MYRILLVEDDSALRYVYSKMKTWAEHGFVIAAESANDRDALETLKKESFDLLVTDIRMPFVDGLALLKEVKDRKIDIVPILIGSYNEFEYARQGLILGAFDFIVKPVNKENLSEVLDRASIYLGEKSQIKSVNKIIENAAVNIGVKIENGGLIKRVCEYISNNMEHKISIDEMADEVRLSKDYFGKNFKSACGMTFNEFYTTIKVEYSKTLIDSGNYKNYEICEILGYSDPDYFTKIFKSVTGITPAAYKSQNN